ncbi:carboxylating nicotinate-nucleotide diphosphorylase [Exilibacterium tricleocarpae]|uniref:Probable nicotinate-nucleotide pyrophosphorylase [carboxylating] n=1 Tax=Exilibacterium tricleocarpae TaxID=2591008 RepID=A0A545TQM4_9GAMM|nr:carboxylating nicotinate-nucleotide diphosphorylase [Exilibacterium tricleocarpae]TQV79514.1 carboxylating nicotinate-nucleotide diphosphorylase [Exilibacterium tricleocarpae]
MFDSIPDLRRDVVDSVRRALAEDVGSGDITAGLIPDSKLANARVITRDNCVVCGQLWVDEVFRQLDPGVDVQWSVKDGDRVQANTELFSLRGKAASLLTGERTALNFLQLLSGTATTSRHYADLVEGTNVKLLDTRKTIPGLRTAQKYAVSCGGCYNHRIGLFDAYLIKENHIEACGGITAAVTTAKTNAPGKPVEVEVENLNDLQEALAAGADIIMLDNFPLELLKQAVAITNGKSSLEASGGITDANLRSVAQTGVDFISLGVLTKNLQSVDLSLRLF